MQAMSESRMIGGSPRMGFRLGLPLTLALSPQAGRGDRVALMARARFRYAEPSFSNV
jgi:hypothetical protein